MKISLYLSVTGMTASADHVAHQAVLACASVKLAANVMPHYSCLSATNRPIPGSDNFHIESGCRIDLLLVHENRLDDVLYLWKRLSDIFDAGCLHMEITGQCGMIYEGCICAWPHYRASQHLIHKKPVTCADDAWHGLTPEQAEERLSAFERDALPGKTRNGKPLYQAIRFVGIE